jgi:phosphoglycolate phosphatase
VNGPPPRPRAILFDWDLTLVDNWAAILEALNTTLGAMGQGRWTAEEARERVRMSLRDSFPEMFGTRWPEAKDIFYATFAERHLKTLEPLPGAADMLAAFHQAGLYLGVVSNKTGQYLRREADHLGWDGYFAKLVGAMDAEEDKPAVAPVEMALEGSAIKRGPDVWFVGDGAIDMECAHNAGCYPVLFGEDQRKGENFGPGEEPGLRVGSCMELAELVGNLYPDLVVNTT